MKRRTFITLIGGTAAWTISARAQQAAMPTVGVLMAGTENSDENRPRISAFQQGLAELGWKDGENIRLVYRWSAGKRELIDRYVRELVALRPDVILANSTPVITTFKELTSSIPVVFALSMDPVGLGHVKSLSHPGGNFTGFTFIDPELVGKWIQLLKDIAPATRQAALLYNPQTTPAYTHFMQQIREAYGSSPIEIKDMPVENATGMETAIRELAATPDTGLMIGPDPFNQVQLKRIAQLAMQVRLPAISVYRPFVSEGGLMTYGPDTADIFRRAASYVNRVLKGEKPADLPVEQPSKFEFLINLKTAQMLGLAVPPTLQAAADEVIE
jgi:putative ABC transport system substrate-binding protein